MGMKKYDIFDLAKFILSISIIALHTRVFSRIIFPWVRLSVPLFFMISSFLFFERKQETDSIRGGY